MNFKAKFGLFLLPILALTSCDASVDQALISEVPVSALQFSDAQRAAEICGRNAPNWIGAEETLKANGYVETTDERLSNIQRTQRAVILESSNSDVLVLLGSRGGEGACVIGMNGMTPQQSFELALPWVSQFGAQTNADRGQGLANNAVQAWGVLEENRIVYIAAFKTWDVLDAPGAAARLLYVER